MRKEGEEMEKEKLEKAKRLFRKSKRSDLY